MFEVNILKGKDMVAEGFKKFCDGLEITLGEFFDTPEFDNLEQEIFKIKNYNLLNFL